MGAIMTGQPMRVACVGAGLVGSAWACVFARAGHMVALFDALGTPALDQSLTRIRAMLEVLASGGLLAEDIGTVLARIAPADTLEAALADVGYVQESAREDLETKRTLFGRMAELTGPDVILASSTSALPGSSFMDVAHPERALVVHPVNPPAFIPLVELCGSGQTSPAVIDRARAFMLDLGMRPVVLRREIDGFLLNRLQFALVGEAMHLVGEGYCTAEDIDTVMTQGLALRWATIGPFEVAHLNAADGFQGFVDRLGPMVRHLGADARTDYAWPEGLAERLQTEMVGRIPLDRLPERAAWRDRNILAVRQLQTKAKAAP